MTPALISCMFCEIAGAGSLYFQKEWGQTFLRIKKSLKRVQNLKFHSKVFSKATKIAYELQAVENSERFAQIHQDV